MKQTPIQGLKELRLKFSDGESFIKYFDDNYLELLKKEQYYYDTKADFESDRVGERYITNEGYWGEIVSYKNIKNCSFQFDNGCLVENKKYEYVKKGRIKNPFHPSIQGVGYLGIGKYTTSINSTETKYYQIFNSMIKRCYSKKYQEKQPTYKDVTVCEEWHNFQVFAEWFNKNYKEGFVLDKDILVKWNKIYSPETCCFVPAEINNIFTGRKQYRGMYPIGVVFNKSKQKFEASLSVNGKGTYLGSYKTPKEAFQVYKKTKENYIKEVADKWKDLINPRVYQAMYNYQVEITD